MDGALQALEELARKKFGLGTSDVEFYSECMNLCNEVPVRIDRDVWEHAAPYIGCIMVVHSTGARIRAYRWYGLHKHTVSAFSFFTFSIHPIRGGKGVQAPMSISERFTIEFGSHQVHGPEAGHQMYVYHRGYCLFSHLLRPMHDVPVLGLQPGSLVARGVRKGYPQHRGNA